MSMPAPAQPSHLRESRLSPISFFSRREATNLSFQSLFRTRMGGSVKCLNIVTIKTLSMCAALWFFYLCGFWKFLICGGVITITRTIVHRLHDQAEESKSLIH